MSSCGSSLFSSFQAPPPRRRWESFAVSYASQAIALAALIVLSILAPRIAPPSLVSAVQLVAPQLAPPPAPAQPVKIAERPAVKPPAPKIAPPVAVAPPKITAPPIRELEKPQRLERAAPVPQMARPRVVEPVPSFNSKVLAALPGPKVAPKIVAVNTFGGSSAAPTLPKRSAARVQTGGFGDPNGVPASRHGSKRAIVSAAGAFDLPQGAGHGNGYGGTSGARGTVASAGFGSGVAMQGGGRHAAHGHTVTASFSNAAQEATRAVAPSRRRHPTPLSVPVSIQSKPTPAYTADARRLRIQGEVLLNVIFTAHGKVKVLHVVRGLGHGLDESAKRAAKGIRFTPAMRNGHPVDSNVTLHIVFQLS